MPVRMRARGFVLPVTALAAVVLTTLGGAGCASDETGSQVLVIGDSLTVGSEVAGLGDGGAAAWTIDAAEGRTTDEGTAIARTRPVSAFDHVVVALGTNDFGASQEGFAAQIDEMMAVLGSTVPVVWVNVDVGTDRLAPAAQGVNPALAAAAARHPNLEVADWAGYINGRPDVDDLRAGDGAHYNADGYDVRARWVESLVAS